MNQVKTQAATLLAQIKSIFSDELNYKDLKPQKHNTMNVINYQEMVKNMTPAQRAELREQGIPTAKCILVNKLDAAIGRFPVMQQQFVYFIDVVCRDAVQYITQP